MLKVRCPIEHDILLSLPNLLESCLSLEVLNWMTIRVEST